MLGRLSGWLFGPTGTERLPERVREAIRRQQQQSEILIGWAELVAVALLFVAYETTSMATGIVQEDYTFDTYVFVLYSLFSLGRLVRRMPRLRLDKERPMRRRMDSLALRGLESLPVRFD